MWKQLRNNMNKNSFDQPPIRELDFNAKKKSYFSHFARSHLSSLRLHEEYGVLEKKEGWRNVSEHCLLEAVAVDILAEKLNLDETIRSELVTGAILHDFHKREQMKLFQEKGASTKSLMESEEVSSRILKEKDFSEGIISVASAAADTKKMAQSFSDTSLSERIIYYIDSITDNNEISTIEKRVSKSEASERYRRINEEAREYLNGQTQLETMRKISTDIQKELAEKLKIEDPTTLPKWIEGEIKKRVEETN